MKKGVENIKNKEQVNRSVKGSLYCSLPIGQIYNRGVVYEQNAIKLTLYTH